MTRMMIETRALRGGYAEWALFEPDARKSGKHRYTKWRQIAIGRCPRAEVGETVAAFVRSDIARELAA